MKENIQVVPAYNLSNQALGKAPTGNRAAAQVLKGYGLITEKGVTLYKNPVVNAAIGRCQINIFTGRSYDPRCSGRNTQRYNMGIYPMRVGDTYQTVNKNGQVGRLIQHSADIAEFTMKESRYKGACYIIKTQTGDPVPVRKGRGIEAYVFTHPLLTRSTAKKNKKESLGHAKRMLNRTEGLISRAQHHLDTSPAYRNGQCITVKRGRIPPKPRVMSQASAEFQAGGACVDLYASRHNMRDVYNALGAIQRRDLIKTHRKWLKKDPASCTRLDISQANSFVCDVMGRIFGRHPLRSCLQDNIRVCMSRVLRQCRSGLIEDWKNDVARIRFAPERKKTECEQAIHTLKVRKEQLEQHKNSVNTATVELRNLNRAQSNGLDRMTLEQSVCRF